jgi:hypothetical protein
VVACGLHGGERLQQRWFGDGVAARRRAAAVAAEENGYGGCGAVGTEMSGRRGSNDEEQC